MYYKDLSTFLSHILIQSSLEILKTSASPGIERRRICRGRKFQQGFLRRLNPFSKLQIRNSNWNSRGLLYLVSTKNMNENFQLQVCVSLKLECEMFQMSRIVAQGWHFTLDRHDAVYRSTRKSNRTLYDPLIS